MCLLDYSGTPGGGSHRSHRVGPSGSHGGYDSSPNYYSAPLDSFSGMSDSRGVGDNRGLAGLLTATSAARAAAEEQYRYNASPTGRGMYPLPKIGERHSPQMVTSSGLVGGGNKETQSSRMPSFASVTGSVYAADSHHHRRLEGGDANVTGPGLGPPGPSSPAPWLNRHPNSFSADRVHPQLFQRVGHPHMHSSSTMFSSHSMMERMSNGRGSSGGGGVGGPRTALPNDHPLRRSHLHNLHHPPGLVERLQGPVPATDPDAEAEVALWESVAAGATEGAEAPEFIPNGMSGFGGGVQ
ncbi:unnamed protein product [Choristocarpus tenellus]